MEQPLGQRLFTEINAHLEAQGLRTGEGTIVDATIIEAPSSTKNRAGARDPEMHQMKKGDQYHIGVDAETGVVHRLSNTPATCMTCTKPTDCCTGGSLRCGAMLGMWGCRNWRRTGSGRWTGKWRSSLDIGGNWNRGAWRPWRSGSRHPFGPRACPRLRSGVEHPFLEVKRRFDYAKVRYQGLVKNTANPQEVLPPATP